MKLLLTLLFLTSAVQNQAPPDTVSLAYCYQSAAENYPVARNIELQRKITDLNVKIANSGYYPNLVVEGEASYQSEVTDFSLPGGGGPPALSKDQYDASLSMTQNIFNGGTVGIRKRLERQKGEQEIQSVKVELHKIRSQIDQVYFGILLSQQQKKVNELLIETLQEQLFEVRSRVKNGVLLPSQEYIIKAELIKTRQDSADIQSNIKAGYGVLSKLTGKEIKVGTSLTLPEPEIDLKALQPKRPEYDLFQINKRVVEKRRDLAQTQKLPSVSAFGTAAYGRPGLDFLNDDFHEYFIIGLRVRWNIRDFFNSDREMEALAMQQRQINQNEKAFTRQLQASLDRVRERIASIQENMERDREIIEIREKIVSESESQLKNGVITATEYITELNRANRARLSLFLNEVQLARARAEYATLMGQSIK